MTRWAITILVLAGSLCIGAYATEANREASVRFETVAINIDSAQQPLGAYQLNFQALAGQVRIVGIEGGEHPAFADPPYYDPAAIQHERVILADFNTAGPADLPHGPTRIATIHLQITGDVEPQYQTELTVAADHKGNAIHASVETKKRGQ